MSGHHPGNYRWRLRAPTSIPTVAVSEPTEEAKEAREEKVKSGARVVPFGFGRAADPPAPAEPQLWEGDYA